MYLQIHDFFLVLVFIDRATLTLLLCVDSEFVFGCLVLDLHRLLLGSQWSLMLIVVECLDVVASHLILLEKTLEHFHIVVIEARLGLLNRARAP